MIQQLLFVSLPTNGRKSQRLKADDDAHSDACANPLMSYRLQTTEFGTHQHNKQLSANAVELICHFLEAKVMEKTMLK